MNLVCDDSIKTSHAQMIFYGGVLVGDLGFGILSDKWVLCSIYPACPVFISFIRIR
jgi:hypothetical protein